MSSKTRLYQILFPLSSCDWWFIRVYILLVFCSPLINHIIDNLKDKKQWHKALIIIFILNFYFSFLHKSEYIAGREFGLINFITLYFIGRYINIIGINLSKSKVLIIIVAIMLLKILLLALGYFNPEIKSYIFLNRYNNPLNIVYATFVLLFFAKLKFRSNFINGIASSVLAVYLLTDHIVIRTLFRDIFNEYFCYISNYNQFVVFLILLVFTILLFCFAILVDKIRLLIFYPLNKIVSRGIDKYGIKKEYKIN